MLEGLLTSWSTGLLNLQSDLEGVWQAALVERMVSGTPEGLVRDFVRAKSGLQRAKAKGLKDLLPYLRETHLEPLIKIQGAFDEQFLQQANKVTEIALRELWGKERYVTAIEAIADLFGAKGFQSAYAATWYRTFVLSLGYNQSQLQILRDTPAGRLFPYLRYRTQRDAAVRPAHARLEGFTASSTWPLWPAFKPPLGWNCRCWLQKITWLQARARGLTGDIAAGVSAAEEWLALGGADF